MLTLQALAYNEGNNQTGGPIWKYATGTFKLNQIKLSNSTVGKCAPMQVIKQPEHGELQQPMKENDPPFRQSMINS